MSEHYHSWPPESEEERKLRELGEKYHTLCENYDRTVCSGISPRTGNALPLTPRESGLINRHAIQVREATVQEGQMLGFSREQVEWAIREYSQ